MQSPAKGCTSVDQLMPRRLKGQAKKGWLAGWLAGSKCTLFEWAQAKEASWHLDAAKVDPKGVGGGGGYAVYMGLQKVEHMAQLPKA